MAVLYQKYPFHGRNRPKSFKHIVTGQLFRSAISLSVTSPWIWTLLTDVPCYSRCDTLKNSHCWIEWVQSIGENWKPFNGNGDVFIWVLNYRVGPILVFFNLMFYSWTKSRRYMADILPIQRKTLYNQSIKQSSNQSSANTLHACKNT